MHNEYFGTLVALRTGGYYIGPVQPCSWSATPMLIGMATPPIDDPRPDTHSLLGVQLSHGVARSSRQLPYRAPKLSTEERLS